MMNGATPGACGLTAPLHHAGNGSWYMIGVGSWVLHGRAVRELVVGRLAGLSWMSVFVGPHVLKKQENQAGERGSYFYIEDLSINQTQDSGAALSPAELVRTWGMRAE